MEQSMAYLFISKFRSIHQDIKSILFCFEIPTRNPEKVLAKKKKKLEVPLNIVRSLYDTAVRKTFSFMM